MSARAIGTATISFGMVSIPVKIYSSTVSSDSIHFHMLDEKSKSRVKQQYVSAQTGEVVPRDRLVKGYEFTKGRYAVFTDEELKKLEEQASKSVDIQEFIPLAKVDPVYYDKGYYLGPDKGAARPYRLLCEAMKKTGRAALARYAARGKQYLVLVRPVDGGVVMQQLHYAHEIRPVGDVAIPDAEVNGKELDLAVQLVEQIASDEFRPENYEDEVRKRYEAAIQAKVEGEEIAAEPTEEPKAKIIDLMEALKASLGEGAAAKKPERKPPQRAAKKAAKKTRKAAEG